MLKVLILNNITGLSPPGDDAVPADIYRLLRERLF